MPCSKEWKFWQYTETGNGPYYGTTAYGVDLDYFNGTPLDLLNYCNIKVSKVGLQEWGDAVTTWLHRAGYDGPGLDTNL